MDIICCPTCKADLTLSVDSEENDEVLSGNLTCSKCKKVYSIKDGIPNLLPQ